jgi:hypothetical protein
VSWEANNPSSSAAGRQCAQTLAVPSDVVKVEVVHTPREMCRGGSAVTVRGLAR